MNKIYATPCWKCGQDQDFLIDGYSYGDRLLEGVMFTLTFKDGDLKVTYPNWQSDPYMSGLNTPYWCDMIEEDIRSHDGCDDMYYCPNCKVRMS